MHVAELDASNYAKALTSQQPKRTQLDPATPTAIDATACLGTGT